MLDHFGITVADMATASKFYDSVLGVLGHRRMMDFQVAIGYGSTEPGFWISTFDGVGANREMHVAFTASDAKTVRAFAEAAEALGAEILHQPRFWPEYHEHYYAVFVRDTEGNNIEAVCHSANDGD